jgi:hypothetical protein
MPVAEALLRLQDRYGWIITYEDPPYVHEDDVVDNTVVPDPSAPARRALDPKGRRLEVGDLPDPGERVDPGSLIRRVLAADAARVGGAGMFDLRRTDEMWHVVPAQIRDREGRWVRVRAVLDAPLSITAEERSLHDLIEVICRAVSEETGFKIWKGTAPWGYFQQRRVTLGADQEPARTVLLRALGTTGRSWSWRLLYAPGDAAFALNIAERPSAGATKK